MNLMEARCLWALMLVTALVVPPARGVWLNLPSSGPKCISEEIDNSVLVIATYYSFYADRDHSDNSTLLPTISVKVWSPFGNELHQEEKVTYGRFGFTTTEPGNYRACFTVDTDHHGKPVSVGLDWLIGIAAKDWDSIAKKEKIEGLDLELKRLEDIVKAIHQKMNHLMIKELRMSRLNWMTNAKVARYSLASLGVCIVASALQLLYLRRYFRNKKLI